MEDDEGVARGHGLDEARVERERGRVGYRVAEQRVATLAHARQVQVALRQRPGLPKQGLR